MKSAVDQRLTASPSSQRRLKRTESGSIITLSRCTQCPRSVDIPNGVTVNLDSKDASGTFKFKSCGSYRLGVERSHVHCLPEPAVPAISTNLLAR